MRVGYATTDDPCADNTRVADAHVAQEQCLHCLHFINHGSSAAKPDDMQPHITATP